MFIRIAVVTALIAGSMAVVADGRLIERAGLVGRCTAVAGPGDDESGSWQACHSGVLEGRPDLTKKSCVSKTIREDVEYWLCPANVVASQTPRG
jgi:hypothetical protein